MCSTLLIFLLTFIAKSTAKSVSLTPRSSKQDGVNVLTHIEEVTRINTDETWQLTTLFQYTWQFIIILDESWGFNSIEKSSLTFTVNSPTPSDSFTQSVDDIIFGFSTNNDEYISMAIGIGNDNPINTNKIFPNCFTPASEKKSAFANGDIATMPDYNRRCDIANGNCELWQDMQPAYSEVINYNTFPINVKFVNDPITNTLELSLDSPTSSIQTCVFQNFPTNKGFKIYFGGNENGQRFAVNSFDIQYDIITPKPTSQPTTNPTENSVPPTMSTLPPTARTKVPTLVTKAPTFKPSSTPTTENPTTNPTDLPTENPTENPTRSPTGNPSVRPTSNPATTTRAPEWTNIFFEDMLTNNNIWTVYNEVSWGVKSSKCPNSNVRCVRMNGCHSSRGGHSYIEKEFDITGVMGVKLQVDIDPSGLEINQSDQCEIWFAYGSSALKEAVVFNTNIKTLDYVYELPTPTHNNLRIKLMARGNSKNSPCGD
eukprot:759215_1